MADQNDKFKRLFNPNVAVVDSASEESKIEVAQEALRVQYAGKIVKHMIDLTVWRNKMCASMLTYIDKVENQIYKIYQQGMNMIIAARLDNMEELQLILNDVKDAAEADLFEKCEEMKELIDRVIQNPGSNKQLKMDVLALLQVMRKPKLPDLTIISKAVKTLIPKKQNRMRAMFSFRSQKKQNQE